ncbi:MAG: hypothetical protein H0W33_04990 [Gammaproteobacteria bacterium]|nr:hypothetical protein [Gammaproteobacteria bacterium]
MKTSVWILLLISGCASTPPNSDLQPATAADGTQTFRFVVEDKPYSGVPAGGQRDFHMHLLGNHLGEQQWCLDGYTISSEGKQGRLIVYEGRCN